MQLEKQDSDVLIYSTNNKKRRSTSKEHAALRQSQAATATTQFRTSTDGKTFKRKLRMRGDNVREQQLQSTDGTLFRPNQTGSTPLRMSFPPDSIQNGLGQDEMRLMSEPVLLQDNKSPFNAGHYIDNIATDTEVINDTEIQYSEHFKLEVKKLLLSNDIDDKEKQRVYKKIKSQYKNDYVQSLCEDHSLSFLKKSKASVGTKVRSSLAFKKTPSPGGHSNSYRSSPSHPSLSPLGTLRQKTHSRCLCCFPEGINQVPVQPGQFLRAQNRIKDKLSNKKQLPAQKKKGFKKVKVAPSFKEIQLFGDQQVGISNDYNIPPKQSAPNAPAPVTDFHDIRLSDLFQKTYHPRISQTIKPKRRLLRQAERPSEIEQSPLSQDSDQVITLPQIIGERKRFMPPGLINRQYEIDCTNLKTINDAVKNTFEPGRIRSKNNRSTVGIKEERESYVSISVGEYVSEVVSKKTPNKTSQALEDEVLEWDQHGRRYIKGDGDPIKVAKLLETLHRNEEDKLIMASSFHAQSQLQVINQPSSQSKYPKFVKPASVQSQNNINKGGQDLKKDVSNPLSVPTHSAVMYEENIKKVKEIRSTLQDKFGPRLLVEQDFMNFQSIQIGGYGSSSDLQFSRPNIQQSNRKRDVFSADKNARSSVQKHQEISQNNPKMHAHRSVSKRIEVSPDGPKMTDELDPETEKVLQNVMSFQGPSHFRKSSLKPMKSQGKITNKNSVERSLPMSQQPGIDQNYAGVRSPNLGSVQTYVASEQPESVYILSQHPGSYSNQVAHQQINYNYKENVVISEIRNAALEPGFNFPQQPENQVTTKQAKGDYNQVVSHQTRTDQTKVVASHRTVKQVVTSAPTSHQCEYHERPGSLGSEKSKKALSSSVSPEPRRLIQTLTQGKVNVDDNTILLINQSEVLAKDGIHGKISQVGIGFGTARHTAQRRSTITTQSMALQKTLPPPPMMLDKGVDCDEPDMYGRALSARTQSVGPQQYSVGLSARSPSERPHQTEKGASALSRTVISVRSANDQVTEGRFEPQLFDANNQTGLDLMDFYYKKPVQAVEVITEPIIIVPEKQYFSLMIQTDPIIDEREVPEPVQLNIPRQSYLCESTRRVIEYLDVPTNEQIAVLELPMPVEPEEEGDDWQESALYRYVHIEQTKLLKKKGVASDFRCDTPKSQKGMNKVQKIDYNLNPFSLPILSETECRHYKAFFRAEENIIVKKTMDVFFEKTKTTIEVLAANMVHQKFIATIFFLNYQQPTRDNIIKLLYRAKILYEARDKAAILLKSIVEIDTLIQPKGTIWRMLQSDDHLSETEQDLVANILQLITRTLVLIGSFKKSCKLFGKKPFKFNGKVHSEHLVSLSNVINGFVRVKGGRNHFVNEEGIQTDQHDQTEIQVQAFEEWHKKSVQMTGKQPKNDMDALLIKVFQKGQQASRVMEMLASLPPPKVTEQRGRERPPHRPITPVAHENFSVAGTSTDNYPIIVQDQRAQMKLSPKVKPILLSKLDVKLRKSTDSRRSPRDNLLQQAIRSVQFSIQSHSDEGEHEPGYRALNEDSFLFNKGPMTSDRLGGPEFEDISEVVAAVDHSYMFAPADSQTLLQTHQVKSVVRYGMSDQLSGENKSPALIIEYNNNQKKQQTMSPFTPQSRAPLPQYTSERTQSGKPFSKNGFAMRAQENVRSEFTLHKNASGHIREGHSEYNDNIESTMPILSQHSSQDEVHLGRVKKVA